MNETQPEPVPVSQIQSIPKKKWFQMKPETKQMLGDVKYLIGTFIVLCLTQLLQPLLQEIMESEMKATWKTWSSIVIPGGLGILIAIIMKIVQGKRQQQGMQQQYAQVPGQYLQQGAQYGQGLITQGQQIGTNLINQGATQLQGVVQQIPTIQVQPAPVVAPTPTPEATPTTTEPKVDPAT